ncbi:MADS-box protein JOINTLESS-like isoform X1 [Prosopis cineraria]|uniref:MADS-box protein JOINTLESS-like isoform X1 n=1 Tax=Prosopis cineraria TaxID=364024 RepID=UPI00240FC320|nr:MADS-box protein JOINTLESS-like isoform X1 [Prosopis cineraria]
MERMVCVSLCFTKDSIVINQILHVVDRDTLSMLSKEEANKVQELRQLNGEELEGLDTKELQKLEEQLEKGLSRVVKAKDEMMLKEIRALKIKRIQLMEENQRLKQGRNVSQEQGQSSESANIGSIFDPPHDDDSSDTSLRLGLVHITCLTVQS